MNIFLKLATCLLLVKVSFGGVVFEDDFNTGNLSKWGTKGSNVSIDQTGGLNNSPAVKWTYNKSGTPPYELIAGIGNHNLSNIYIRVYFKAVKDSTTSGAKFIKPMGKLDSRGFYANSTFGLNQWNDTLNEVAYGMGLNNNDTTQILRFDGTMRTGVDPLVTYPVKKGAINPFSGIWHCYEVHMKYSTLANRDGEYDVWLNGDLHFSARNVINHGPDNKTEFALVRFGDYAGSPFEGNWELWMDNIVISDQYIGPIDTHTSTLTYPKNFKKNP